MSERTGVPAGAVGDVAATDQRARLDRERILDAAGRILDSEGLKKLTLRRIGTELGVDPTALYRHFASKDVMLDALAERVLRREPELDSGQSWQGRVRVLARHGLARYRAHPDLAGRLARQADETAGVIQVRERWLQVLTEAGLEIEQAALMTRLLENHVVGSGLLSAISSSRRRPLPDQAAALRRAYALADQQQTPHVVAAARHLFPDADEMFDQATELLIEAIQLQARRNR